MALEENIGEENNAYNEENNHLVELGGSDYEIVDGEPDIKGWDVKNEEGQKVGDVAELLFDPRSRKVRYIVLDLNSNEFSVDTDRKVLVPIGVATIYDSEAKEKEDDVEDAETSDATVTDPPYDMDRGHSTLTENEALADDDEEMDYDEDESSYDPEYDSDVVIIPVTFQQLQQLPEYKKGEITPETEIGVRRVFEGTDVIDAANYNRHEFYDHHHFNEQGYFDRGTTTPITGDTEEPYDGTNNANKI